MVVLGSGLLAQRNIQSRIYVLSRGVNATGTLVQFSLRAAITALHALLFVTLPLAGSAFENSESTPVIDWGSGTPFGSIQPTTITSSDRIPTSTDKRELIEPPPL